MSELSLALMQTGLHCHWSEIASVVWHVEAMGVSCFLVTFCRELCFKLLGSRVRKGRQRQSLCSIYH